MESNIQFVTNLKEFIQMVLTTLNNENDYQILISGTFDHSLFKEIIDNLIVNKKIDKCKVLTPYVSSNGIVSRSYINKISNSGGEVRINSIFKKNLIVIGKEVFILSLSSKYIKDLGIKSHFECAVQTNDGKTVNFIYDIFEKMWDKSMPIEKA